MSVKLSYVVKKSDWLKLSILILVGAIAISTLYVEYQKTSSEYDRVMASYSATN